MKMRCKVDESFDDLEKLKEWIIGVDGRLPTEEEIAIARKYLECLNMYKTVQRPVTERDLLQSAPMWVNLTNKLGDGDPIKAAKKHAEIMLGLHEAMELSTSDKSEGQH